MYHAIKYKKQHKPGFTLVELLVAIAIIGIISIVGVRILYDVVSIRAKQQTIEDSSDSFRVLARLITKSVMESQSVSVPNSHELRIIGEDHCQTIRYDPVTGSILHSKITNPCTPPDAGLIKLTSDDLVITNCNLSPTGVSVKVLSLELQGYYKNSLSNHPLVYKTTISSRL